MKKIFLLFLFFICSISVHSQNYWQESYSGNFYNFYPYTLPSLEVSAEGNVFALADSFLIRSADNGLSWQNIYTIPFGPPSVFGSSSTGVIYLNSDSLRKSIDGGNSWITTSHPHYFVALWFLTANDDGDLFTETGVLSGSYSFRSTNEGTSWSQIGVPNALLQSISFHPDGNTYAIFVGNLPPGQSYLFKSSNKGDDWVNISGAPSSSIVYVSKNGNIYLGTFSTLLRSIDNGLTWEIILNQEVLDITENQLGHLFIASNGSGVFRSVDEGTTWQQINSGLSFYLSPTNLTIDSAGYLYVISGTDLSSQTKLFRSVESTIPVELISFTAKVNSQSVELDWVTATEINNYGFEVEKSQKSNSPQAEKGQNDWEKIGFVRGHGTTTEFKTYSFSDDKISTGNYKYRLKQIDFNGTYAYSDEIEVHVDLSPTKYVLQQNFPNPFNAVTIIKYSLPYASEVKIDIYKVTGEKITELVNGNLESGYHEIKWDASAYASGIYFCTIKARSSETGVYNSVRKMTLLK